MFFILMYYSLIQKKKNRFVILKLLGFTKKKKEGRDREGKRK